MDTVATMARENSGTASKLRTYSGIRGVTLDRAVRENGGATLDLSSPTLAPATHTTGYYVGGSTKALTAPLGAVDTRHYQHALNSVFTELGGVGYFGVWADGHTVYMEGSEWFEDENAAILKAQERNEIAIWDVANGADIFVC